MTSYTGQWVCFRDLPDDVLEEMPEYVKKAFLEGRKFNFAVELVCTDAPAPTVERARRRLVIISDNNPEEDIHGPLAFRLDVLSNDIKACKRIFLIAGYEQGSYDTAYEQACADLHSNDVSVIVETTPEFQQTWLDTLMSIRGSNNFVYGEGNAYKY